MNVQTVPWRDGNWKVPFFTIWSGQALSLIGSRIATFALVWWLTDETGSATVLAMATLFALLPNIVLGPFAGVYVDRWNRRTTMIVADSAIAGVSLWLAYLFWTGDIQVWHVYVITFARAFGSIFHWPAMQSTTSMMVPKEHLGRVSGINQAMYGGMNIVGPALGALLLKVADIYHIMLIDVVTAAFAVTPLVFIMLPQPKRTNGNSAVESDSKPSLWADLREGLVYLLDWRGLMILTAMALVVKLALTPAFSLIPLLVTEHFLGDADELAWLEAAFGVGVIGGGLLLGVWGGFKRNMYTSMTGILILGVAMLALGLTPSGGVIIAVGLIFAMGIAVSFTDGPLIAVLQATIDPEMQGRVFNMFGSLISISSPIGLAIAGPVTDLIGIQVWYLSAGALCLGMGAWALFVPSLMNIEDYGHAATEGVEADNETGAGTADSAGEPELIGAD
jgi:DHA3 family macrolide efflux protein-like MFS transporter